MNTYKITSTKINPNRVFILQKSELEKRLDPFYYIPEIFELVMNDSDLFKNNKLNIEIITGNLQS